MFDKRYSIVKHASIDDSRRGGYKNVELIVDEVNGQVRDAKIIGIRNKDYSCILDPEVSFPENIFVTDTRDLELMLLESESVSSVLKCWANPLYEEAFATAKDVACFLGYLRIYNHIYLLSCDFHRLKVSRIWNQNTHELHDNWKQHCLSLFDEVISEVDLKDFVRKYKLFELSWYDICRGHDLIKFLSLALIRQEFNYEAIFNKMVNSYSVNDFSKTDLYASIYKWQAVNNVSILL